MSALSIFAIQISFTYFEFEVAILDHLKKNSNLNKTWRHRRSIYDFQD